MNPSPLNPPRPQGAAPAATTAARPATGLRTRPIRVLIVDDSAVVRSLIQRSLATDPGIQVVGSAPDPYVARDMIVQHSPDVITLDVEMPRMDGVTFLRKLMEHHPIPVIVLSSLTGPGTTTALEALNAGAVEVLAKGDSPYAMGKLGAELVAKVRLAAAARVRPRGGLAGAAPSAGEAASAGANAGPNLTTTTAKIVALGASTGGVQALTEVLTQLPRTVPGIVIVQHMPAKFTASFAARLSQVCQIEVKEAVEGDAVMPGRALLAPGGFHMTLQRSGASYRVQVRDGPDVHHQKPSVEVLFQSVARWAGPNAVGGILTGMGGDGATGLLAMRQAGARTFAQDESSCVVFGMPAEAIRCGAAQHVVRLDQVPRQILQLVQEIRS